ncbi:MAG: hypothetical protein ACRDZX_09565, partial [Acidimicrobiales bacterium]
SVLLAGLFYERVVDAPWPFIGVVMATFFLASAGASAAYLTSSEIFPMETRALAIAFFYAIGTAVGGISGPLLCGPLIGTKHRGPVAIAFLIGAGLMFVGGVAEMLWGVRAEGAQLEDIARPLTAEGVEGAGQEAGGGEAAGAGTDEEAGAGAGPGRPAPLALEIWRRRTQAAEHQAEAAEHRARAFELMAAAAGGDPGARSRAEQELRMGDVWEAKALADAERAAAAEERAGQAEAAEDGQGGGRAFHGPGAAGPGEAAERRAESHEEEAAALQSGNEAEVARHRELAAAAVEKAREAEQRRLAAEARARLAGAGDEEAEGPERARSDGARRGGGQTQSGPAYLPADGASEEANRAALQMHELWAQTHSQRARAHELRAGGDAAGAAAEDAAADVTEQRARAAAYHLEAAERRAEARAARGRGPSPAEEEERARIQVRTRARRRRQAGLRRYRPGPGRLGAAPGTIVAPAPPEEALDREIGAVERALQEHGPTEQGELARIVGARYWGPGVFPEALRQAVEEGGARRLSRRVFAPGDGPPGADLAGNGSPKDAPGTS